jgi:hypothetical protein
MYTLNQVTHEFWFQFDAVHELWHALLVGAVLVLVSLAFLWDFVRPAYRLKSKLGSAILALQEVVNKVKVREAGNLIELKEVSEGLRSAPELVHSWSEYAETLHPQYVLDDTGQNRISRWRSTALAETFFSEQAIVDAPLNADFYKHLPGILTGLGIIGTFLGLIVGLSSFEVTDPAKAQAELKYLINSVGHAFYVSGAAIFLAMLCTWIEKSLITARHRQVGELCQLIDSLFDAGAGEEYLARLVAASETQATQAAHIKDALVADLKEILHTLTDNMSKQVGKAIVDTLGGPFGEIAEAVKGVKENQGDAVNRMLTDVLAGFSAQMEQMFGGQMRGMTDLLKETSDAMRLTAEKFSLLASEMDTAGKGTVEAMGEKLNSAISSMEARQQLMNKYMSEFVEQIRNMVSASQSESAQKLQETLQLVGQQVASVIANLRAQTEEAARLHGGRQEEFKQSTEAAVQSLTSQMQSLMAQAVETNRSLQEAVAKLSAVTSDAIGKMNQGADTLYIASSDFAKAGQGVAETMRAAGVVTNDMKSVSSTLSGASSAAKDVLADYAHTRDTFAAMVSELKSVTEAARRDSLMSSGFIAGIEAAAQKMSSAQKQADEYLKGVNDVLASTHESFAEHVGKTLKEGNRQFQSELRTAVDMVSAAVRDLSDTLEDMPGRGR